MKKITLNESLAVSGGFKHEEKYLDYTPLVYFAAGYFVATHGGYQIDYHNPKQMAVFAILSYEICKDIYYRTSDYFQSE